MKFCDAVKAMLVGKKVRRPESQWTAGCYLFIEDNEFKFCDSTGNVGRASAAIYTDQVLADDWYVYETFGDLKPGHKFKVGDLEFVKLYRDQTAGDNGEPINAFCLSGDQKWWPYHFALSESVNHVGFMNW